MRLLPLSVSCPPVEQLFVFHDYAVWGPLFYVFLLTILLPAQVIMDASGATTNRNTWEVETVGEQAPAAKRIKLTTDPGPSVSQEPPKTLKLMGVVVKATGDNDT